MCMGIFLRWVLYLLQRSKWHLKDQSDPKGQILASIPLCQDALPPGTLEGCCAVTHKWLPSRKANIQPRNGSCPCKGRLQGQVWLRVAGAGYAAPTHASQSAPFAPAGQSSGCCPITGSFMAPLHPSCAPSPRDDPLWNQLMLSFLRPNPNCWSKPAKPGKLHGAHANIGWNLFLSPRTGNAAPKAQPT